ncbi:unnamed protein product [Ilex paraguariensis]|uniref:Uncharacterized protein n=1 Tax=Ilex paraguariensis TaxID=185542 RepID=A0ABC8SCD5_9AQUA
MTPVIQDEAPGGMTANSENMLATNDVNQIEGVDGDTNFLEFAPAPCTPGLVEEPNLSNVQETSACDDHLELEDHSLTDFALKENLENGFSKSDLHHGNENVVDSRGDVDSHTVIHMSAEENGFHLGDVDINQLRPQGQSSALADQARGISSVSELSDRMVVASSGPYRDEDLRSDLVSNNVPGIHSIDGSLEDHLEPQKVWLGEITPGMPSLSRTCQLVSEGFLEDNQASPKPEVSNKMGIAGNLKDYCVVSVASELIAESKGGPDLETQVCEEPKDPRDLDVAIQEEMASTDTCVLPPCNTHLNQPAKICPGVGSSLDPDSLSEFSGLGSLETSGREKAPLASRASFLLQGEECHATGGLEQVFEENHVIEPASCENIQAVCSKSNDQAENGISGDSQFENRSACSDMPAPEKLLSVPEGRLADPTSNLLVAYTPDKGVSAGADGDGAGSNIISGKKRSFTESTLTVQSLDTVKSLEVVGTKRTAEPIPDDDDLLSSILVGRRSSAFKVKPTPAGPEITSTKRARSAARITASKRKVLTDDTMVLHGDTIRLQLTTTEDIRRVRKKAPCTRLEISMIQKQFVEDEIFCEPILTGVSTELAALHSQTYDLSTSTVYQNFVNTSPLEAPADVKLTSQNDENGTNLEAANIDQENGMDDSIDCLAVGVSSEAQPPKTAALTESQNCEGHALNSELYDNQVQMKPSDVAKHWILEHDLLGETQMEIDGKSISVDDAVNPAVTIGIEASHPADPVSVDIHDISADTPQLASLDKTSEADASVQIDALGVSPDQKLDPTGSSSGKGVDGNETADRKDDNIAGAETESRSKNELFSEGTQACASMEVGIDILNDCSTYMEGANENQAMKELRRHEQVSMEKDEILDAAVEFNAKDSTPNGFSGEEPIMDSPYGAEVNVEVKNVSVDGGNPGGLDSYPLRMTDIEHNVVDQDHRDVSCLLGFLTLL